VAGFGPVVTGSLVAGAISKDQKLELLPERRPVRVRRLEVHGKETARALAGERVSANLAGVELSDLSRGKELAAPGALAVSALLTVRIHLLPSAPRARSGDRFFFHHFSAEARARLRLIDRVELLPGGSARAQLRLSAAVPAVPGDRFVLRRLSPVETIGGGVILDPLWPPIARTRTGEIDRLERLENGDLSERAALWIEQAREGGVEDGELAARAGTSSEEIRAALAGPLAAGRVHALRRSPNRYLAEASLLRLAERATSEIEAFLSAGTASVGMPRRTLLSRLMPAADARWSEAVESALVVRGVFRVAGEEARPPGREDLPAGERDLSQRIVEIYRERGLDPPSPSEVAERVRHRQKVVEGLIGYLAKKGDLARLPGGWLVAREAVDGVIARLRGSGRASIDVGEFKEMFGLTRRLAIPLLEYLDASKITRRVGDRREILPT
jgi:selenocysteine-specific elongation factor